eukprot:TRINITY_DN27535_c0_g1_i1.p1 TRINITY_DN27535_c0_g1~~TRINITY_DN27535_c0_g1_i1.p1  ORF type:complete len:1007 (-),score=225.24 TRINITY_DN27535_c0_g1_i1:173-3193(-)
MGFMSRRVLPVCGSMCVCCPGLRSRSRQPVKRYKKLCSDIFPKTQDEQPNERKITKLADYAAKNPLRIPKIAVLLEQRGYKELRSDHLGSIRVIMMTFICLLSRCKEQMTLFAMSLLSMIHILLEQSQKVELQVLACHTLKSFIYSQTDGTYVQNLNGLVHKVCELAHENKDQCRSQQLKAACLQALSAMVWFMGQRSNISSNFDEIVSVTLEHYDEDTGHDRGSIHHTWVDEVRRCEGRSATSMVKDSPSNIDLEEMKSRFKDQSNLTKEEMDDPKVWSRICVQNMVQLAKETTTVRRVLEPIFLYFDSGKHWTHEDGFAFIVLRDMSYLMQSTGNSELLLGAIVRHLDHKNIANNPQMKADIIKVVGLIARQSTPKTTAFEVSIVNDLCRHLRRSVQVTMEAAGQVEISYNLSLQNSIEECLLELTKRVKCPEAIFSMMAMALEKLSTVPTVARASIRAMLILSQIVATVLNQSFLQQGFPDALFHQLLQAMMHRDSETRVVAHRVFCIILVPTLVSLKSECQTHSVGTQPVPQMMQSKSLLAFASSSFSPEKVRNEKHIPRDENIRGMLNSQEKESESIAEWRQDGCFRNPSRFNAIDFSISDMRAISSTPHDTEISTLKLSKDLTVQMLSALWIQATLPDNLPQNFEAIAHTFCLSLFVSQTKNQNIIVRAFQLALCLRGFAVDLSGQLPLSRRKSLFTLSTSMLGIAAEVYNIPDIADLSKRMLTSEIRDPYLELTEDFRLIVKPNVDIRMYVSDEHTGLTSPSQWLALNKTHETLVENIAQALSVISGEDASGIAQQLSEPFSPVDDFAFGPQLQLKTNSSQKMAFSKPSLSFDEVLPVNSSVDEEVTSEASVTDLPQLLSQANAPTVPRHIISVGQLLESALEAAGQVASSTVSTSPISFSAMAGQCEAFGCSTRKKLAVSLNQDSNLGSFMLKLPANEDLKSTVSENLNTIVKKKDEVRSEFQRSYHQYQEQLPQEPWQAIRLPAASPFDNFLKAAGC